MSKCLCEDLEIRYSPAAQCMDIICVHLFAEKCLERLKTELNMKIIINHV